MQQVICSCGEVINPKRVEVLRNTVDISKMKCINCAQKEPDQKVKAEFKYNGGADGERPRHW